jgi:hypothetical protein
MREVQRTTAGNLWRMRARQEQDAGSDGENTRREAVSDEENGVRM